MNNCPVCGKPAILTCKCLLRDSRCKNGHEWYHCAVHDKVVLGISDHSKNSFECQCEIPIPIDATRKINKEVDIFTRKLK